MPCLLRLNAIRAERTLNIHFVAEWLKVGIVSIAIYQQLFATKTEQLVSPTLRFRKKSLQIERQPVLNDANRHPIQIHRGRDLEGILA